MDVGVVTSLLPFIFIFIHITQCILTPHFHALHAENAKKSSPGSCIAALGSSHWSNVTVDAKPYDRLSMVVL